MITIAEAVESQLNQDPVIYSLLKKGLINYSEYARQIKDSVSEFTKKEVELGTIVVSLSRIASKKTKPIDLIKEVQIDNISLHTNLFDITYAKTANSLELLGKLPRNKGSFFARTVSQNEITVIDNQDLSDNITRIMRPAEVIYEEYDLAGITVHFRKQYLSIPNVVYSITHQLAVQEINITEIVSTATELTYIVSKGKTEETLAQLSKLAK